MKIKSIAALCKKVRHAVIMDSASADGSIVQFIGDGNAAYICDGLPTVEEESLLAIFDVPQEQRNTWHVKRSNVYDMLLTSNDMPLYESRVHITYGGKELIPLYTHMRRIVFIDAKYLAPLADNPTMELYLRNANSTPVVAAKTGFIDLAIIGYDFVEQFILELQDKLGVVIVQVGYDRYNAISTVQKLEAAGIECVEVRQHSSVLHSPTKLLQEKILSRKFAYNENRMLEINFENARCTEDTNRNKYVNKKRSAGKVDMVVAIINGVYLQEQEDLYGMDFVIQT